MGLTKWSWQAIGTALILRELTSRRELEGAFEVSGSKGDVRDRKFKEFANVTASF
ncbi:hypothetical protein [Paraburkholderia sp. SG-MS1]|uniref:hypothetical protein n=1 Tax=Paraburkholderia sp. SG-MS1 TaxID=2023741 RepID=UPI001445AC5E|nr:hypothetical protein [Paraburkholderia sp. SG-MS1]